ncbi:hypothetical protein VTK73DRAFT_5887 [Phialemonium thermophilum]|uniref:Uncharacterized protein n=1 Tax=Phialemonium thermophilum TaxID=223376 RepID=A0ABR3XXT6_9PEZI
MIILELSPGSRLPDPPKSEPFFIHICALTPSRHLFSGSEARRPTRRWPQPGDSSALPQVRNVSCMCTWRRGCTDIVLDRLVLSARRLQVPKLENEAGD